MYLLLKPRKEKENYVKGEIMDIFGVLSFVGGLAMFLYGMSAMGDGPVSYTHLTLPTIA